MLTTEYSEADKSYYDLLYNVTDGIESLSAAHTQRDALGADLVGLFVNHGSYCGLAWLDSNSAKAFSVTSHFCVDIHVLAHEIGHNFGALHDVANSVGMNTYPYAHGYIHHQNLWRTIQSYPNRCFNCPAIGHFSNPDVDYDGDATGTVTTHDVARVHRERAATIADFRPTVVDSKAAITSPIQGSTLTDTMVTFEWNAGIGAQAYHITAGSTVGGTQYHDSGSLDMSTLSTSVSDLPADGSTVYVRLYTEFANGWQHTDYTYTAASPPEKAVMSSPTPGSTLTSTEATFEWTAGRGVDGYWLYVGTNGAGSANIFSGGGAQTSRNITDLPGSGTVNVRLMSYIGGSWQLNDYTYTMDAAVKGVMSSPTPGSTLTSTEAAFNWTAGTGVAGYWLYVGNNGAGSANIFSGGGAQRTRTVTGLPASGTVNVRLMSYIGSAWQFNDYTYTMNAAVKAVMTWPTPGSAITNPWASFTWTAAQGASSYWLYIGTNGVGSANILSTGVTGTTRSVTGLPHVGMLYVRLMTYAGGGWQYNDYTYTMSVPAMMSTPTPGSTLPGPGVMFQWYGHASIGNYWLYVGTVGAGSGNILSAGVTNTWRYVGGLPASGTVNVRLMSWVGGAWRFRDYTYTGGAGGDPLGEEEFSSFLRQMSLE